MIDATRRAQIIVLLETRDEYLPVLESRDNIARGFVAGVGQDGQPLRWLTCEDCLANDRPMFGCETCGGAGRVPDHGPDPYANAQPQRYGLDPTRHDKRYQRDRDITTAARSGQDRPASTAGELAEANKHPYGWEREAARRWRNYDYAALDNALELLRQHDDGAYKLVHACYVYGWLETSAVMEHAIERGLAFIDARMPAVIRAPGHDVPADVAKDSLWRGKTVKHAEQREARKDRVLRAYFDWGWSTLQIAAHESLTDRRVRQLVAGSQAVASGPAA